MYCRWFASCENQAIGLASHPVLKAVPICYRCAMQLGIHVPVPTCSVCGADVPLPHGFDYQELLYCSYDCFAVETYLTMGDLEAVRHHLSIANQTRY